MLREGFLWVWVKEILTGRKWDMLWSVVGVLFLKPGIKDVKNLIGFQGDFFGYRIISYGGDVGLIFGVRLEACDGFEVIVIALGAFPL